MHRNGSGVLDSFLSELSVTPHGLGSSQEIRFRAMWRPAKPGLKLYVW